MSVVAVTGANGFVGRALVDLMVRRGIPVRALVRETDERCAALRGAQVVRTGDMVAVVDWRPFLEEAEAVVHLAARVHRMRREHSGQAEMYDAENARVTSKLASDARAVGVRHFIFMSSIKVLGERSGERPLVASDPPNPLDDYGRSKLAAENALAELAGISSDFRVTILRPPLVYGPGVKANFLRLMQAVHRGIPLPLGKVVNRRSMISVGNLADAICAALRRTGRTAERLLVADREALSTSDLIRMVARFMGKRARLIPVPLAALRMLAVTLGRQEELRRLCDSLVVDAGETCRLLQWEPPQHVEEGVQQTVEAFLACAR